MTVPLPLPIRFGRAADMPAAIALLQAAQLPTADLTSVANLQTWVLDASGSIQGVIALERTGSEGLLRSLAVHPDYRNRGVGRELVSRLERDAAVAGVTQLVLLTQTAEPFFRKLGYQMLDRRHVSDGMNRCAEFQSLCPVSAVCMMKAVAWREPAGATHG